MDEWVAVELPDEIVEELVDLVRRGRFRSLSEVVAEALRTYLCSEGRGRREVYERRRPGIVLVDGEA